MTEPTKRDEREYVWNTLEDMATRSDARPFEAPNEPMIERMTTLSAVGLVKRIPGKTYGWELTDLGRAFCGGLHGGRTGRESSPYDREPQRSVWLLAAGMMRELRVRQGKRAGRA
jgi:ribosome modulation factor